MTVRGSNQTLTATFRSSPSGPVVDVTGLTLTITLDGDPVLGPLSPPTVLHDGVGLYRYVWAIPADAEPGTYTAVWSGILPGDTTPTVGYETIEVTEFMVLDVPDFGACLWPMDPACANDEWNVYPDTVKTRGLAIASATLQRLTGNRVSNCPITIRPCLPTVAEAYGLTPWLSSYSTFSPVNWGGNWTNVVCQPQECVSACEIALPGPVGRLDEVKVDGVALDLNDLAVYNGRYLTWMGAGNCPWPLSQDLSLADTEVGTFSVTYLNSYPVDGHGAYAVGVLALEFAKACAGDECALPEAVTTIVRQGITLDVISGSFPNGETGLREVDTFIALWNPGHLRQAPTVWSPDQPTHRVRTL